MYKIIGADKREYGPVEAEQVRQWIRDGRANAQTSAKAEDNDEWKPLGTFPEFAEQLPASGATEAPPAPFASELSAASARGIFGGESTVQIGDCLSRSWELLKANLGLLVGATALVMVIGMGCGFIPVLGSIAGFVISGPLYGGLYALYLKRIRGEPAAVGDIFAGFSQHFVQLMLAMIVVSLLTLASALVSILAAALGALHLLPPSIAVALGVVGLVPPLYLMVAWMFTLPLVIDQEMDFWPAMELSRKKVGLHWWRLFGLFIVGSLITIAGVVLCVVGMFFTLPIFIGALMYAYEDIFGAFIAASA